MKYKIIGLILVATLSGCATSEKTQRVDNSGFSILPGTKIFAEAKIAGDGSIDLVKVSLIKNPDITLTFNLTKMDSGMMLSVKNPLDKTIKYHLNMIDFNGKAHNTSSCPVRAGLSVFETWPHAIPEIIVTNIHLALKGEKGMCIY